MRRFRRSPHVVGFWSESRVYLHNYATGTWIGGSATLCSIADACSSWRSLDEIVERRRDIDRQSVRRLVRRLSDAHILHRSDRPAPPGERAMRTLAPWNPAAGFLHSESKKVFYFDEPVLGRPRARAVGHPRWPVKRYPGSPVVRLPVSPVRGDFPDVVLGRRSWRRFGQGAVPLSDAALLLRLTAGMNMFVPTRNAGLIPLRTSPSAGACHPLELYVLALRIGGLARGLYHYASDRHVLERLRSGVKRGGVRRYLPAQHGFDAAAALVFFCARYDRIIGRYPYVRAYRAASIEAGHLCQTFCLTATWLGLAPFCSMALDDRHVEEDLGLDGVGESVLYAAGVGIRPADRADAAAPPGVRGRRPVPNPAFRLPRK